MPAERTLRSRLVRLFYRIVSPRHSRGWIEGDREPQPNGELRLFTEGLGRFDLPELEICDCAADQRLLGYCHGMIFIAVGALQSSRAQGKSINAGEIVDLRPNEDAFPIRVRLVASGPETFRLEDLNPGDNRFPSAAAATCITEAAAAMRRPLAVEQAARLAIAIHARDISYEAEDPSDDEILDALESSNGRPYFLLADALAATRRKDEAMKVLEEGIARAPYFAERMKGEAGATGIGGPVGDHLASVDPWEIQARRRDDASRAR